MGAPQTSPVPAVLLRASALRPMATMVQFEQLVLDEAPDAVIITTPPGEVLYWSRGAERMFGFRRAEALGRTLDELIVPPGQAGSVQPARDALERGVASYETVRRAKDGALLDIDATCRRIEPADGGPALILACEKDVTDLRARREAGRAREHFAALLDSIADAIVVVNAGGRIVLANARAERLFGYGSGELCGQPADRLLAERHRGALVLAPGDDGTVAIELDGLHRDGHAIELELRRGTLRFDQATLTVGSIRADSQRSNDGLPGGREARRPGGVRTGDGLLATMAHELRTPLNAIIGFTGTLLMRLPGPLTADQEKQLNTVQGSARHLLSLINDLLDLARIDAGRFELRQQPVDLRELLADVAASVRPLAEEKGLRLDLEPGDRAGQLATDREVVGRILAQLAGAAIRHAEGGGVELGLHRRDDPDLPVELRVAGTGGAIPPDRHELLVRALRPVDGLPSRDHDGTGLGLHLAQQLAGLLRGRIEFDGDDGRGCAFRLLLPEE
jgi:PAS domain S-box-containing protein